MSSILPLLLSLLLPAASAEQESLLPTQSLSDGKTLLSPSEEFELGFFSPTGSSNRYLGIWYHKIPVQTVVWVANRIAPLHDKSGLLTIRPDGNLAVIDGEGSILWWTHLPSVADTSFAVLMDTGNLVLYTNNGDMGRAVSWQSFDHPTDTLLPGMRIGYDGKSNRSRRLTSWRNSADPAPGVFTYGLDHGDADQFFIWNGSRRHWRSGSWNGRSFNQIPGASNIFLFHFSLVKVEDEAYFEYSALYNNTRLKMDISGEIKCMLWYDTSRAWGVAWFAPSSSCGLYGSCGVNSICSEFEQAKCKCLPGYDPAPSPEVGCRRRRELVCGVEHGYLPAGKLKVPDMESLVEAKSVGLCRTECSKDCNCTAYVFANANGHGGSQCLHWFGGLVDVASMKEPYGAQHIFLKVSPSDLGNVLRVV